MALLGSIRKRMDALMRSPLLGNIPGDIMGGLMTAIVALPMAMAFGVASGLGAAAGLYGAMACGLFAALFGGTPGQQSGPTGPMAVVAATILAGHADRPELLFAATIGAGLLQVLLGRTGAGQLIRYVPYPVVSGFMTGIALIIIIVHIQPFFGIAGSKQVLDSLAAIPEIPARLNPTAMLVGVISLAIIYGARVVWKRLPASLIALLGATVISVVMGWDVPRIGEIPQGLPVPVVPLLALDDMHFVLTGAITLAVLGALDSLLTSLVVDKMLHIRHDSDKELVGQGIGNFVTGFIGGLAGAGSTTRTLANIDAGGRTALSGVVYALLILAVVTGLGKLAAFVPLSSLAAILIAIGVSIVDWRGLRRIRTAPRDDVFVMLSVLVLTVAVDLIVAVGVGTALACILFVKKLSDVQMSKHGHLDTLENLHGVVERLPLELRRRIYIYTFTGPLFFGQAKNFTAAMSGLPDVRYLVLKFYSIPLIDESWSVALEDAISQLRKKGVHVLFVGLEPAVVEILERMDILHLVDPDHCFDNVEAAIAHITTVEVEHATAASSRHSQAS